MRTPHNQVYIYPIYWLSVITRTCQTGSYLKPIVSKPLNKAKNIRENATAPKGTTI